MTEEQIQLVAGDWPGILDCEPDGLTNQPVCHGHSLVGRGNSTPPLVYTPTTQRCLVQPSDYPCYSIIVVNKYINNTNIVADDLTFFSTNSKGTVHSLSYNTKLLSEKLIILAQSVIQHQIILKYKNGLQSRPRFCVIDVEYRKIPKISPGAYIFQRPSLRGLFLEGLMCKGNLRFKIDWANSQWEGNLLFLLCFTLYSSLKRAHDGCHFRLCPNYEQFLCQAFHTDHF